MFWDRFHIGDMTQVAQQPGQAGSSAQLLQDPLSEVDVPCLRHGEDSEEGDG